MDTATYIERRGKIEAYFDRTAAEAWKRLTSDAGHQEVEIYYSS